MKALTEEKKSGVTFIRETQINAKMHESNEELSVTSSSALLTNVIITVICH